MGAVIRRLRIGNITVDVDEHGTRIAWPDGSTVTRHPHDTTDYRATAERLGYGTDTLRMSIEHELCHVLLGYWAGLPSAVMAQLRGGDAEPLAVCLEEDVVIALQKYLRARGVDVVRLAATV